MADSTATTTDKIIIKHRYTDAVLFEYQPTADQQASGLAMCAALEAANLDGANLREAEQREAAAIAADLAYMQGREAREWRMQERALEDQQRLLAAQGML